MHINRLATLLVAAGLAACGGEGDEQAEAPQASAASPSCSGTLEGAAAGPFTCTAVANFFAEGPGRADNGVVTILSNPYDPTHTRPAGVQHVGINIEVPGEPASGTFTLGDRVVSADGAVNLDGDVQYGRTTALTLVLEAVQFLTEQEVEGTGVIRSYNLDGRAEFTVTGADGQEVRVRATF